MRVDYSMDNSLNNNIVRTHFIEIMHKCRTENYLIEFHPPISPTQHPYVCRTGNISIFHLD